MEEAEARFRAAEISVAENTFVCDDGSGSLVTEPVIDTTGFEGEGLPVSDWSVVSGTGAYEKLRGDGSHRYLGVSEIYAESPLKAVLQVMAGEVSSD